MSSFLQNANPSKVQLMDGAMGTQLQLAGIQEGECYEHWNLIHPEVVRAIHAAYVQAGADVLLTNTFQANPFHLQRHGLLPYGFAIAAAAVQLAKSFANVQILGAIGPMPASAGGADFPQTEALEVMARWLTGVDGLLLETCSDASALDAASWFKSRWPEMPVLLSMTYHRDPHQGLCTTDGMVPEQIAARAKKVGVAALGVNCGLEQGIANIAEVVRRYRQANDLPLFARPNAGTPQKIGSQWIYPLSPESMAAQVGELVQAGVCMIGGCCGTTPEHIRAMLRAMRHRINIASP